MRRALGQLTVAACVFYVGCRAASSDPKAPASVSKSDQLGTSDPLANVFADLEAGFKIEKPPTWHFVTSRSERTARQRLSIGNAHADKRIRQEPEALIVIGKDLHPAAPCNPTVKVRLGPEASLPGPTGRDKATSLLNVMQRAIPTFEQRGPVGEAIVAGRSAGYLEATFMIEMDQDPTRACKVLTRVWIVPRADDLIVIGMSGSADDDELGAIFASVLNSIEIRDP